MWSRPTVAALATSIALCCGCAHQARDFSSGGDAQRGAAAISHYGCGACHTIAGISGASGKVGPPLTGVGSRVYVAGSLPNTPDNLIRWVQDPHSVNDHTVMPKLGVTQKDATDIAAYLYELR